MSKTLIARIGALLCLAALVAAVLPSSAAAATVSERSPVRPGLWWDAAHAGSGFEIQTAPGQLFVVWYTYRADGSPVWYTAQGAMAAEGRLATTLLEHRWSDGRYAGATPVGTLVLLRENNESLTASWSLHGTEGAWSLAPFALAGGTPEVDHTGAWFDPGANGYGLTIGEQGDWLTAAYYVYDASGAATWSFGTNGGEGARVALDRFSGSCPSCPYAAPRVAASAAVTLDFHGETALSATIADAAGAFAPEWRRTGQALALLTTPGSQRAADRTLASFDGEPQLRAYIRNGLTQPPPAGVDFSAAPSPQAFSTTNLIEAGVDEGDRVKTDGHYVYAFDADENGNPEPRVRVARIEGAGPQLATLAPIALTAPFGAEGVSNPQLYVTDAQLVALSSTPQRYYYLPIAAPAILPPQTYEQSHLDVEILDRGNAAAPSSSYRARIDGTLVASRRIGDQLYLVHRYTPTVEGYHFNATDDATRAANDALVDGLPIERFLPQISVNGAAPVALLDASRVLLPPVASVHPTLQFVVITRIKLSQPADRESIAVLGTIENVYASTANLYLATSRYEPIVDPIYGDVWTGFTTTDLHQIALDGPHPQFTASGSVEGYIGGSLETTQFRLSERDGALRVVTSGDFGALGRNRVTTVTRSAIAPGVLRIVSTLPNRAHATPLGRADEQLYATRFVDDRLYAVTYHNIDPLYVVSLAPAEDPRIAGSVELTGFSEYLHPLPNGLLLGFGKDAVPATGTSSDGRFDWYQGLKLALFDVSNLAAPRVIDSRVIGKRGSQSALLNDHHAFSSLDLGAGRFRFAIPMSVHDADGTEPHPTPDSYYYPFLQGGLYAFDLDTGLGANARLQPFAPLVTAKRGAIDGYNDDAAQQARSVLLPGGAIYVEHGHFWFAPWSDLGHATGPL